MTDEEMTDKYAEKVVKHKMAVHDIFNEIVTKKEIKEAVMYGLKAGRPKWHKVADGDLPKNRRNVWITYINAYYQTETTEASFRHKYWVISGHRTECDVIAWCEIPTYEDKE